MKNNQLNYLNNPQIPQFGNVEYGNPQDERLFGGFLGPFILGGITGGLVAPYFNNNYGYNQPPYYTNNYYYPPYYYGPNYYY